MPPTRDPHPYPKLENEESFTGQPRSSQKAPYTSPTHIAQQKDPWHRLHATPTLASIRKDVNYFEPEVPKDDLDFRIKTLYDHHSGFLQDKSQVLLHSETVNDDHGRLKMPIPEELPPPVLPYKTIQGTLRHWVNPKKESIYSVQGTIVSPHNAATNGGFSRKMDGGFFST
ncbi:protein C1orf194 homolog isoform X2 [Ornithorhynchus anatinus]|uniref:Uncharacterized protein n=1 Tax=Ornithorhynchus anatinus TaxID=9258 RepID=A0A6I8NI11_ORNAN|nr:protein C1orf194 homolog isoform X2 [Ornithorhynchus anatinus]